MKTKTDTETETNDNKYLLAIASPFSLRIYPWFVDKIEKNMHMLSPLLVGLLAIASPQQVLRSKYIFSATLHILSCCATHLAGKILNNRDYNRSDDAPTHTHSYTDTGRHRLTHKSVHTHTHTHTHARAYLHLHTRTRTHTRVRARIHTHHTLFSFTHSPTRARSLSQDKMCMLYMYFINMLVSTSND